MTIPAIGGASALPFTPPALPTQGAQSAQETGGSSFAKGLDAVSKLEGNADQLASKVATGSLDNIHDFTTAAAKASLAVSLTAGLRNRAVEAYQEIMRMQV